MESIVDKIDKKKFRVETIGLEYVGFPVMWTFNKNDLSTFVIKVYEKDVPDPKWNIFHKNLFE